MKPGNLKCHRVKESSDRARERHAVTVQRFTDSNVSIALEQSISHPTLPPFSCLPVSRGSAFEIHALQGGTGKYRRGTKEQPQTKTAKWTIGARNSLFFSSICLLVTISQLLLFSALLGNCCKIPHPSQKSNLRGSFQHGCQRGSTEPRAGGFTLQSWHLTAACPSWQGNSSPELGSVLESTTQRGLRQQSGHTPQSSSLAREARGRGNFPRVNPSFISRKAKPTASAILEAKQAVFAIIKEGIPVSTPSIFGEKKKIQSSSYCITVQTCHLPPFCDTAVTSGKPETALNQGPHSIQFKAC